MKREGKGGFEALLTERGVELLIPPICPRTKFLKALEKLKSEENQLKAKSKNQESIQELDDNEDDPMEM